MKPIIDSNSYMNRVKSANVCLQDLKIRIAVQNILIKHPHKYLSDLCINYHSSFDEPDIIISLTEEDFNTFEYISQYDYNEFILNNSKVDISFNKNDLESYIVHREIAKNMLKYDTFLIHGAVVATYNNGYMFVAPSGTGKTTRVKLWIDEYPDSYVVNGDKPLIKVTDTNIFACGTPWCGKEGWNKNVMVPLKVIFLLERSTETSIEEISLGQAFPLLLQHTYRPTEQKMMIKTISLLKKLYGKVKIYKFHSAPTVESIQMAYETATMNL